MRLEPALGHVEQTGIGTTETIDRLFLITHDQNAAISRGAPRRHFLKQRKQKSPLGRVGILEFVYEQMIDALIELVLNPLGVLTAVEEAVGLPLKIIEIQQPLLCLDPLIMIQQSITAVIPCVCRTRGAQAQLVVVDLL